MLSFHDTLPDLAGHTCSGLLAQEYWQGSHQLSASNVVFLQCDSVIWHRFFIDAGVVFWRSSEEPPSVPRDSDEHRYVLGDLGRRHGLVGQTIRGVHTQDLPAGGEIRISFENGATVVLRDTEDHLELEVGDADKPVA